MIIAFAITPEIDLLDLFTLVEPLKRIKVTPVKPQHLTLDFCTISELPVSVTSIMQAQLINPAITPSLDKYDLVIVVGSQPGTEISSAEVKRWLGTISAKANVMTTGNAAILMNSIQTRPAAQLQQAANRLEVISLGVRLVQLIGGEDAKKKAIQLLGLTPDQVEKALLPGRQARLSRKTKETEVDLSLSLDGSGKNEISTGIPFFDHMLTQIAVHGLFDLSLQVKGDLNVDPHHTVEDTGLALGKAFDQALGDRKGLVRMATATVPMDESLALVSLDFSGRPYTVVNATWNDIKVGDLPVTLITHFLESFATQARCNLSVRLLTGGDDHHRAEAIFKALARALDAATQIDPRRMNAIPSSKGVL